MKRWPSFPRSGGAAVGVAGLALPRRSVGARVWSAGSFPRSGVGTCALLFLVLLSNPLVAQPDERAVEMQRIINIERNKLERPMLVYSKTLSGVAQAHAEELAGKIATSDTTGGKTRTLRDRILATGQPFLMVAENVANGMEEPKGAFDEWMKDRKNWSKMFRKEYTEIGIGYAHNPRSKYRHYWVVVLGTPKEADEGISLPR